MAFDGQSPLTLTVLFISFGKGKLKMKGQIGTAFGMLILIPLIVLVPELIVYGVQTQKVSTIASNITREAERQGGVPQGVKDYAYSQLADNGLDTKGYKVSYNRTGVINAGEKIEVTVKGTYEFSMFNFLGTGLGTSKLDIIQKETGYSQVWQR